VIARVCVLLALIAWPLQSLDDAARRGVQLAREPWLDAPMHAASEDARFALIVGAGVAAVSGAAGRAVLIEGAVALAPVNLAVEALKYAIDRARPDGTRRRSNASFPSSHAANAFAVAIVLARRWRRGATGFLLLAALVAYSRMYLDRHWLTDVVAGAALGAGGAWIMLRAWKRWNDRRALARAA
jgi:membrane-associated phospholipid phosphatase